MLTAPVRVQSQGIEIYPTDRDDAPVRAATLGFESKMAESARRLHHLPTHKASMSTSNTFPNRLLVFVPTP